MFCILFIIFILGLCIGSFLNVLVFREVKGDKWFWGRSYCDFCKKRLYWYDNIPLLSYILLKGRCRFCQQKIDVQYPLVEFLTGIEFVWIYFLINSNLMLLSRFEGFYSLLLLLVWLCLGACFLAIFVADIKYQIIPDSAIIFGMLVSLFKLWADYRFTGMIDFSVFLAGLGAGLFFLFLISITKGKGMGYGDVKLGILVGLILGFPKVVVALFLAFLTGAITGVILIITNKKKLKSKIAFGPFIIIGFIIALVYGQKIWSLYF